MCSADVNISEVEHEFILGMVRSLSSSWDLRNVLAAPHLLVNPDHHTTTWTHSSEAKMSREKCRGGSANSWCTGRRVRLKRDIDLRFEIFEIFCADRTTKSWLLTHLLLFVFFYEICQSGSGNSILVLSTQNVVVFYSVLVSPLSHILPEGNWGRRHGYRESWQGSLMMSNIDCVSFASFVLRTNSK